MKKEMLINVLQPEECRIAIVEDGQLEELYVERASQESYVGNIYKGKIVNIEQGIQAAFVDFGIGRNGFLHVTDVDPMYYKHLLSRDVLDELDRAENGGGRGRGGPPRDRGPERGPRRRESAPEAPREMTTFLPPEPSPSHVPVEAAFTEDISEELQQAGGFFDGLDDDSPPPAAPPVRRMPIEVTNVVAAPKPTMAPAAARTPPPIPVAPPPPPPPAPKEDDDWGDFGSGIDLFDTPPSHTPPPLPKMEVEAETEEVESAFGEIDEPTEDEAPKKKPRAGLPAKKAPGKATKAKVEEKAKAKPKKPKKKSEDDDEPKTRPMESAERRSTDDEPEIQPFFDDGVGFDVDAPNDRFSAKPEPQEDDEEFEGESGESESPFVETKTGGEEAFSDRDMAELDAATEKRFRENDQERDRRRGGGGGGGRGGDRGPRRDGGGDRGPRSGPGGPGGPPRGPMRGGPIQNKAHTRHKGLPIPPIQEIFKRGQEVIVQVIKEGMGTKGPTLSTFVSIAGRYLVLMPSLNRVGVSKKIEDRDSRHRLRDIMNGLNPPKGVGFIVRTAAVDRDETELRNDLTYLLRLWQVVVKRIRRPGPVEVYRESDMITRTIRDLFTADIDCIVVDEAKSFDHASEFLQVVMPKYASRIRHHADAEPLFHRYRVEEEIAKLNHKRLDLQGGGSLIIEQTEALVSIDVNSGNFRAEGNAEETAFQMNMRAAKEIARQLRLRDLGGVIVNDFIDMRHESHRRQVEDTLRNALRRDKARTKILRISEFGLIEMTRQRMQPSLKKRVYNDCPHCTGTGTVKTHETMGIDVMRLLQLAAHRCPAGSKINVSVHADAAVYLLNRKRKDIAELETKASLEVAIEGKFGVSPDLCEIRCTDANGTEIRMNAPAAPMRAGRFAPEGNGGNRRHSAD